MYPRRPSGRSRESSTSLDIPSNRVRHSLGALPYRIEDYNNGAPPHEVGTFFPHD